MAEEGVRFYGSDRSYCVRQGLCQLDNKLSYPLQALKLTLLSSDRALDTRLILSFPSFLSKGKERICLRQYPAGSALSHSPGTAVSSSPADSVQKAVLGPHKRTFLSLALRMLWARERNRPNWRDNIASSEGFSKAMPPRNDWRGFCHPEPMRNGSSLHKQRRRQ